MSKIKINLGEVSESRVNDKDIPDSEKDTLSVTFKKPGENNPGEKLRDAFSWAKDRTSSGTGITITFEDNGGEKKSVYIDGDGADRIIEVK